ncbi:hypothetical protein ACROYT_G013925 [Oculina patagonica]
MAWEIEEKDREAEELANLVRTKAEVVKNLEWRLVNAKKVIAELKAQVGKIRMQRPKINPRKSSSTSKGKLQVASVHTAWHPYTSTTTKFSSTKRRMHSLPFQKGIILTYYEAANLFKIDGDGRVQIFAGTNVEGSQDGPVLECQFE